MTTAVHRYRACCDWSGSTAAGYERYGRAHTVTCPPATATLELSADPAFRGDAARLDPEDLLLAAVSSCQLLSFLALAAKARLDVVAYHDDAEAEMPADARPARITEIRPRPHITFHGEPDEMRVHRLVALAHEQCFIANSLACAIDIRARP